MFHDKLDFTWWNSVGSHCQWWGIGSHTRTLFQCFQLHEEDSEEGQLWKEVWLEKPSNLERYQVPPYSWLIRWLYFIIKMIKNDVIDVLIPSKNFCHLTDSAFTNFNPKDWSHIENNIATIHKQTGQLQPVHPLDTSGALILSIMIFTTKSYQQILL